MNENNGRKLRFLISGGGTGGHIFPALSIADALRRRHHDCEILFVGALGRMEMKRVPQAGYKIVGLPVSGFDRKRLWRNFSVLFHLWKSMSMARRIVAEFKPDVAIGVGGYASGPTLKAAQRAGVRTVLQEQNSYPGVTNKLLAAKADRICVAYPRLERYFPAEKIVVTGNPVRKSILEPGMTREEAKKSFGLDKNKPLVLVVGGSLGAGTLNNAVISALKEGKVASAGFNIMWQTGAYYAGRCCAAANDYPADNLIITEFITDMAVAYCAADLVVARAGAGTISELELLGKPAILVPSPNVAEDHQRRNAEALVGNEAAGMVLDADVPAVLWRTICSVIENRTTLQMLGDNILKLALPDSDEKIADTVDTLIENR